MPCASNSKPSHFVTNSKTNDVRDPITLGRDRSGSMSDRHRLIQHVRSSADFGRDATLGSSPLGAGSRHPRRDDVHSGAELSLIAQALIVAARMVPSNIGLTAGRAAPRLIIGNISMGQSGLRPSGIICGRDTRRGGQRRDRDEHEGSHDGPPPFEGSQCEVMTISSSMSVGRAFRVSGCCGLCHITYGVGRLR